MFRENDTNLKCQRSISTDVISVVTNQKNISTYKGETVITLYFQDTSDFTFCGINKIYSCVFWNYNSSKWDSSGCNYTLVESGTHKCECQHLTSFAVLIVSTVTIIKYLIIKLILLIPLKGSKS